MTSPSLKVFKVHIYEVQADLKKHGAQAQRCPIQGYKLKIMREEWVLMGEVLPEPRGERRVKNSAVTNIKEYSNSRAN